jgi:triosephosphate isomerase
MPVSRRPLVAGNWKMNGLQAEAEALATDLARRTWAVGAPAFDLVLCPPFTLVARVAAAVAGSGIALGGQDCHAEAKGAHTGDISAAMLADLGCSFVIVGHSERRADHGENDALVKAKAETALAAGLCAIVCIGETAAERQAGRTLATVAGQLDASLPAGADAVHTVIAYEPVWAIGSGRTPSAEEVQEVHAHIRAELAERLGGDEAGAIRILYGGSVKPENAAALLTLADVDGGLIGGASLDANGFWSIAESCV